MQQGRWNLHRPVYRANSLQKLYKDRIFFIGPDLWEDKENPWFVKIGVSMQSGATLPSNHNLEIRAGRWNVPGEPIVFLVKFEAFSRSRTTSIPPCGKTTA